MKMVIRLALAAWLAVFSPTVLAAQELSEERVRELVRETILANPEILLEAIAVLENRAAESEQLSRADIIEQQRLTLERDPNAPVLANAEGDVTVVEFFDYNCPYCRRVMPTVYALTEADTGVRLVYREWPILGEGSVFASRAALASREQGLYEEFHIAMMDMTGRAEERSVLTIAREIGLDVDQLLIDMEAPEVDEHIATSMRLAEMLGITGTPTFIIGTNLVPGAVEQATLQALVDEARADASN